MSQKIHFLLWRTPIEVSGVTTAARRMQRALQESGVDSKIILVWPHPDTRYHEGADYVIRGWKDYRNFLIEEGSVNLVVLSQGSFVVPLLQTYLAKISGARVTILGDYQSDHEEEYYQWTKLFEQVSDGLICVSRRIQNEVRRRVNPSMPVHYVPRGVSVTPKIPELSAGSLRLIYTGRLVQRQKRILDFVEFVEALEQAGRPYVLTFVGEGPEKNRLREALRRQQSIGKIHFAGTVAVEEVLALCRQSHAFVNLSEYEGLSQSMVEAMGQGCFPVVTRVSGVDQVVRPHQNGLVGEVGHPRLLAEKLVHLSERQVEGLRRSAWEWVRDDFSPAASVAALLSAVEASQTRPTRPQLSYTQVRQQLWFHRMKRQVNRLRWAKFVRYAKESFATLTPHAPNGTL